jgi:hypothetical protein
MDIRKKISPNIDRIAKDSIVFENAFTRGTVTYISLHKLFNASSFSTFLEKLITLYWNKPLPRKLKTVGIDIEFKNSFLSFYRKINIGLLSFLLKKYLRKVSYLRFLSRFYEVYIVTNAPFYHYIEKHPLINLEIISRKNALLRNPFLITRKALEIMENDQNFFIICHYLQPHPPYISPYVKEKFTVKKFEYLASQALKKGVLEKKILEKMNKAYDGCIKWVDSALKLIIEKAKEKQAIIAITSDHGQLHGEYGLLGHFPGVYVKELMHIPLIIYTGKEKKRVKKKFWLDRLLPLLLRLGQGKSLKA